MKTAERRNPTNPIPLDRSWKIRFFGAILVATLFSYPQLLEAQCGVLTLIDPPCANKGTTVGMSARDSAGIILTGLPNCMITASMNASCYVGVVSAGSYGCPATRQGEDGGCRSLFGYVGIMSSSCPLPATVRTCMFTCTGCLTRGTTSFTVDNASGLPIELMDFSVTSSAFGNEDSSPKTTSSGVTSSH